MRHNWLILIYIVWGSRNIPHFLEYSRSIPVINTGARKSKLKTWNISLSTHNIILKLY